MRRRENLRPDGLRSFETGLTTHGGGWMVHVGPGPWLLTCPTITHPLERRRYMITMTFASEFCNGSLVLIISLIKSNEMSNALSIGRLPKSAMISSHILPVPLPFHYQNEAGDYHDHQSQDFCTRGGRDFQPAILIITIIKADEMREVWGLPSPFRLPSVLLISFFRFWFCPFLSFWSLDGLQGSSVDDLDDQETFRPATG